MSSTINDLDTDDLQEEKNSKLIKIYEKLGDSYCAIGLYETGLENYFKQVNHKNNSHLLDSFLF